MSRIFFKVVGVDVKYFFYQFERTGPPGGREQRVVAVLDSATIGVFYK